MRTRMRYGMAALAAVFASSTHALTVAEFEQLEKRAAQGDAGANSAAMHYMAGVANSLAVIRERQINGAGPLVCAPSGVPLSAEEVRARYRDFLQTHPDVYDVQHTVLVPEIVLAGYDARYCGGASEEIPRPGQQ